ncbi:hypothetical protein GYMC52_0331 [Geobacillus sp. Y412MC52]|nr:hypothetical protein GYMC52_0331 [Geobacillus sp. Y412MC52]
MDVQIKEVYRSYYLRFLTLNLTDMDMDESIYV